MRYFVFGFYNDKNQQTQNKRSEEEKKSFDSYMDEYQRLEKLREDSENIWEERTYQLSAGGLSLTFAVFSFLMRGNNDMKFQWPMVVILGSFVLCLVINYISQIIAAKHFETLQELLYNDRCKNIDYDENRLIERNKQYDFWMNVFNYFTMIVLVLNIIFTVVYICILFT